jgi:hypothetical protein
MGCLKSRTAGNAGGLEFGHLRHQKKRFTLTRSAGRRTLEFERFSGEFKQINGLRR